MGFNGGRAESGDVIDVLCHRIETVLQDQARVDRTWAQYGVVVLRRLADAVCDFVPWPGIVGLVLCYVGDVVSGT